MQVCKLVRSCIRVRVCMCVCVYVCVCGKKVRGEQNVADVLTKHLGEKRLSTLLALMPVMVERTQSAEDQNHTLSE